MTREETISMLERLRFPEPWEPKLSKGAEEALDVALSVLSENKGEWIPINDIEDIPKGEWLVTIDHKVVTSVKWEITFRENGRWVFGRDFYYRYWEFDEGCEVVSDIAKSIVAYMPVLPEPYKKGE